MIYSFINWRKLHDVRLHKLYLLPDIIRIIKERKEIEWLVNVECDMRHVYMQLHETCVHAVISLIIVNNQLFLVAVMYMYTKLQTQ